MPWSDYFKQAALDHVFNQAAFTSLTSVLVGLSSTLPTSTGTNVTEPDSNSPAGGYARVSVATSAFTRSGNIIDNDSEIAFPESDGAWLSSAALPYVVLYDPNSPEQFLGWGVLTSSPARTVTAAGITLKFNAGELNISLTDS